MYSDVAYAPYGEQYSQAGTADPSFTGQNSDTTSALYDFTFREHSMSQGRWISPDPAGLAAVDPTNPQSWNRYAYVMNNPMAFIDPDGMDCVYLNDAGTGVDWIDSSSDAQYDCENGIGGYWIQGSVLDSSWVNIDVNSGLVSGFGLGADGLDFSIAGAAGTNPWGYWSQTTNVPFAANNESWWSALKHTPWVLSWILPLGPVPGVAGVGPAGSIAWNPATKTLCGSIRRRSLRR